MGRQAVADSPALRTTTTAPPHTQDALFSSLLLSPSLSTFLTLNQQRLSAAHARATAFLRAHNVPYRPASAGHFIWVDLRAWAAREDGRSEGEREDGLARRLWSEGVNLVRLSLSLSLSLFPSLFATARRSFC